MATCDQAASVTQNEEVRTPTFLLKGFATTEKRRSLFSKPEIVKKLWSTLYEAADEAEIRQKLHEFKWTVESIDPYTRKDEEKAWRELRRKIESGEAKVFSPSVFRNWSKQLALPLALSATLGFLIAVGGFYGAPPFGIQSSWALGVAGVLMLFCAKRIFDVRDELGTWGLTDSKTH